MFRNAIRRFFSRYTVHNFYYYLHEFSYGRFFTYVIDSEFPEVQKVGFQHGPASRRRLLFYLARNEADTGSKKFLEHLPMPDEVLSEDDLSRNIYLNAGYRNVKVMKKIYRLGYLEGLERKNIRKNTVLVACGLHDSVYLFETLKDEIVANPHKKYIIKLHPRQTPVDFKLRIEKLKISNCEIADRHVSFYLSWVSEVVVTYSSVGYEAYLLNIPVRVIDLPNKINESPLLDIMGDSERQFCYDT